MLESSSQPTKADTSQLCIGCDKPLTDAGHSFIVGRMCSPCAHKWDVLCDALDKANLGPLA